MILRPNGNPARKKVIPLNRTDVKTVIDFERWCLQMGLALDLYCPKCADTLGPAKSRCWGNNQKDATTYHLECHCTDRVHGTSVTPRAERAIIAPKIQVMVP